MIDGANLRVPLPVRDGAAVTFRYRDKTGEDSSGNDQTTTRSASVAVEIDAPDITITTPESGSATSSRRPTFSGSVLDGGGSGLQVSSLRLVIDNDISDTGNTTAVFDIAGAINSAGYFLRPTNQDIAYNMAGDVVRTLVGEEDSTTGLYATDSDYEDGRDDVAFSYTPGNNANLFPSEDLINIDNIIDFQVHVYDLAGNVGFSDADDTEEGVAGVEDDFEAHTVNIDGSRPGLVDTESSPGGFPIRVGDTDVRLFGNTQTGLVWDIADQRLETNNRFIMVVFDDPVEDVAPEDFDVDFSTAGFSDPAVVRTVLPSNADIMDAYFTDAVTAGEITQPEADAIVELLERTVFLELNADIPPEDESVVTVTGVVDAAGNTIDTDADSEPANDGLGPEVSVRLSGGSGVGADADDRGPGTLTGEAITITIASDEDGERPRLNFYQGEAVNGASPQVGSEVRARSVLRGTRVFEYEYEFTPSKVSAANGVVCLVATVSDGDSNTSTSGVADCDSSNAITFILDSVAPALDTARFDQQSPPYSITVFDQRPLIQIPLAEEVQADSIDLRVNGEDIPDAQVTSSDNRVFVYQPTSDLTFESHMIEVRATDFAGNQSGFNTFNVIVEERSDFEIGLSAGWNLISFPSNPENPSVGSVFSNPAIQTVSTFDAANFRNGDMQANRSAITGNFSGSLTSIRAGLAYWVFSNTITNLEVRLQGPSSATSGNQPVLTVIPTIPGVNFVGVVDSSRSQTQGQIANAVLTQQPATGAAQDVEVSDYLDGAEYTRVYTYDTLNNRFVQLENTDNVRIGQGLLVYINPDASGRTAPIVP